MHKSFKYLILLMAIFFSLNLFGQGYYAPDDIKVETPHTKWGEKLDAKPIKLLALVAGRANGDTRKGDYIQPGSKLRDALELLQRFKFNANIFIMESPWSSNTVPMLQEQTRLEKLIDKGDYDVLLLGNYLFDALSPKLKYKLLSQIIKGKGLVCIGHKPKKLFLDKNSISTPSWLTNGAGVWMSEVFDKVRGENESRTMQNLISCYRVGKGHGVYIKYPIEPLAITPLLEYSKTNSLLYNYWSAWIGKIILWTDDYNMQVKVSGQGNNAVCLSGSAGKCDVSIIIKNARGQLIKVERQSVELSSDKKIIDVDIKSQPNGIYYAEVSIDKDSRRIGFGCVAIRVSGKPAISDIKITPDFYDSLSPCQPKVEIKASDQKNAVVEVSLLTADERIIWKASQTLNGNKVDISLPKDSLYYPTTAMEISAKLVIDGEVCDEKYVKLTATHRNRDRFNFVVYERDKDVLSYYAFKTLKEKAGVTAVQCWIDPGEVLAANSLAQVNYMFKIDHRLDKNGINKLFSWNDNDKIDSWGMERIKLVATQARKHGVLAYGLGDEPVPYSVDKSDADQKAYVNFLQKKYLTIDSLNIAWKSDYKSFADIQLLDKNDLEENIAKKKKLYARWYDRQLFMRKSFTNIFRRFNKLFEKFDPHAIVGFEGAGTLQEGPDFAGLTGCNGFWTTYDDVAFDVITAKVPDNFIRSRWTGYSKSYQSMVSYAWDVLMRGGNSLWWWRWDGVGKFHGLINPELDFYPQVKVFLQKIKVIRDGLGDLLRHSKMADDGVAILYSDVSRCAATLDKFANLGSFANEHQAFIQMFRNLGIGFRYITPQDIDEGYLTDKKTKLLIMPMAYAISDASAARIKEFVRNGGTVLADIYPGLIDNSCNIRKSGVLDDMFGVSHEFNKSKFVTSGVNLISGNRQAMLSVILGNLKLNKTVKHELSQGMPIMIDASYGKGRAILLNYTLVRWGELTDQHAQIACDYWLGRLKNLGVDPGISIRVLPPCDRSKIQMARYYSGRLEVLLIRNNSKLPATISVKTTKDMVFTGADKKIIPGRNRHKIFLPPTIKVFALSNERLMEPKINIDASAKSGQPFTAVINFGRPDIKRSAVIQLVSPDGRAVAWSKKIMVSQNGKIEYRYIPAWNDSDGTWKLQVSPVFSKQVTAELLKH